VLLVLSAPCQLFVLEGPEHGRTIPLADSRRGSQSTRSSVCHKLLLVFFIQELIEWQVIVVYFRIHPALHPLRWIKRALTGSNDNKPLSLLGSVTCLEQPVSPVRIFRAGVWAADRKCRRLFTKYPMIMIVEEIFFDFAGRIWRKVRKPINTRCLFPRYRKAAHLLTIAKSGA
jgi:hypothetical protein